VLTHDGLAAQRGNDGGMQIDISDSDGSTDMAKRRRFVSGSDEEELKLLGSRITLARIRRGLTQAEIAGGIGSRI
jgi:hypothetical protein